MGWAAYAVCRLRVWIPDACVQACWCQSDESQVNKSRWDLWYGSAASARREGKVCLQEQQIRSSQAECCWSHSLLWFCTPVSASWQTNGDDGIKEQNVTTARSHLTIQAFSYSLEFGGIEIKSVYKWSISILIKQVAAHTFLHLGKLNCILLTICLVKCLRDF